MTAIKSEEVWRDMTKATGRAADKVAGGTAKKAVNAPTSAAPVSIPPAVGDVSNSASGNVSVPTVAGDAADASGPHGWRKLTKIPLVFLGIGIYRAWIELCFVYPIVEFPTFQIAGNNLYDIFMVAALLFAAVTARKFAPYLTRRWSYVACGATMVLSTLLMILAYYFPHTAGFLAIPAAALGGVGTALVILLWSELYGCLNSFRVVLYYSGSIAVGAVLIFILRGFTTPYLLGSLIILPFASLLCVWKSFQMVPEADRPRENIARFSFPWKPILLMAIYAFAFGLYQTSSPISAGTHSSLATFAVGVLVFALVLWSPKRIPFSSVYRIAIPVMVFGLLLVPVAFSKATEVSAFCITMSYTAFWILMMDICANVCYRYGVSAIWLFGIERGLRAIFQVGGRMTHDWLVSSSGLTTGASDLLMSAIGVMAVIVGTMILFSEKDFSTRWGMTFLNPGTADKATVEKNRLTEACRDLGDRYHLSQRENEVLYLLAQGKTIATVTDELYIAEGTAKAHMRHIYEKLDIHSRQELFDMLGVASAGDKPAEA